MTDESKAPEKAHGNNVIIKAIAGEQTVIRESRQLDIDPFQGFYGDEIIRPLYDPELLIRLAENSDILQQCVDAYSTNIVGFGIQLRYDDDYDKLDDAKKAELDAIWTKYERFFQYSNIDESFSTLMSHVIDDREKIGWGVIEVIEDSLGKPAGFEHVPGQKVRLCKKDRVPTEVAVTILNEEDKPIEIKVHKRFQRFVQIVNEKKVYFKEFGDPRTLNYKTGIFEDNIPPDDQANSMIMFENHCSYTEYGLPRYLGQLLNIQGNRKAEELNYTYFSEGRHIPMAISVENGKLTDSSLETLKETKGDAARHKYIILEAEGAENEISIGDDNKRSGVRIHFDPLVHMLEKDGLFQDYCKNNRDKIRSSFRLHPLYTGESQDYTRATADTARQVTEEQVFQPLREPIAFKLNNLLKPALGITGVSMEFKAPVISDKSEISKALVPFIDAGAATPNMLIDALGELLGKTFEAFEGEWANRPMSMVLAELPAYRYQGALPDGTAIEKSSEVSNIVESLKDLQRIVKAAIAA